MKLWLFLAALFFVFGNFASALAASSCIDNSNLPRCEIKRVDQEEYFEDQLEKSVDKFETCGQDFEGALDIKIPESDLKLIMSGLVEDPSRNYRHNSSGNCRSYYKVVYADQESSSIFSNESQALMEAAFLHSEKKCNFPFDVEVDVSKIIGQ